MVDIRTILIPFFVRGWREGEERLNSGKDIPTFIPRTYLWSRRDSSPPKSLTPAAEGGRKNFSFTRGSSVEVMAITEEWKQMLQSTRQQQMLASGEGGEGERRAKQTRESTSTQKLLYTRFVDVREMKKEGRKKEAWLNKQQGKAPVWH